MKPKSKSVKNKVFSSPEWYVSLATDVLDFKFATLAKDLGKALSPEVIDTAKELLDIYILTFNNTLESLGFDQRVKAKNGYEQLFFKSIINPDFPSFHPVYYKLVQQFSNSMELDLGKEVSEEWSDIRNKLKKDFVTTFGGALDPASASYPNAQKYIQDLKKYVVPIESRVISHMNSVLEEVEYEALAIDPELVLRKSYVTPSCHSRRIKIASDTPENKVECDNIIQALIEHVKSENSPVVIHGQPGHGKTSTVKVLASALAQVYQSEEKPFTFLFYECKDLRALGDPTLQVLNYSTPFLENEDFFDGKHTVLILDGLDERQLADGSDEALKSFVSGLFGLAEKVNKDCQSKLNIILTGRSQYVGQIKSSFSQDHIVYEISDFSDEQVQLWLGRFNSQKAKSEDVTVEKLNKYHLQDLISQPILLASSAIMLCDQDGKSLLRKLDSSIVNRTQVYKTIIEWSYKKKWQKTPTNSSLNDKINFDDYFVLLQAIAFEMFKTGNESIKLTALAVALKESFFELDFITNKSIDNIEKLCSQLRISFFFKGVEDKAFSFIHKSIKDFLIVSGIVDSFIILLTNCNIRKLDKEAAELYKIWGVGRLSSEDHIPMLDEWLIEKNSLIRMKNEELLAIWERIGNRNLPVSFDTPDQAILSQSNVLYNYYELISRYFAKFPPEDIKELFDCEKIILFKNEESKYELISFIDFFTQQPSARVESLCFSNQIINHSGTEPFPPYMMSHDFSNSILRGCHIDNCHLEYCNFNSAQLLDCWLIDTTIKCCSFIGAELDCLTANIFKGDETEDLSFYNKFSTCDFSKASLIDKNDKAGFITPARRRNLFWNCTLDTATFKCDKTSTVEYSASFTGQKRLI